MIHRLTRRLTALAAGMLLLGSSAAWAQDWDSVVGAVTTVGEPTPHWFILKGYNIAYLVDGDSGDVQGNLTLSMFSPALAPHPHHLVRVHRLVLLDAPGPGDLCRQVRVVADPKADAAGVRGQVEVD